MRRIVFLYFTAITIIAIFSIILRGVLFPAVTQLRYIAQRNSEIEIITTQLIAEDAYNYASGTQAELSSARVIQEKAVTRYNSDHANDQPFIEIDLLDRLVSTWRGPTLMFLMAALIGFMYMAGRD